MKNKHPRLGKFIRRINRGLALGLAVVIVMTVWLSVSAAKLKSETPELKELTKQYIIDLFEVSAAMNGDEVGDRVPDSTAVKMRASLEEIVGKYYTDSAAAQLTYKDNARRVNGVQLVDDFDDWVKTARAFHIESAEIIETEEMTSGGYVVKNYYFYTTQKATKYLEVEYGFEVVTTVVTDDLYNINAYPFSTKGGYIEYYSDDKYVESGKGDDALTEGKICRAELTVYVSGSLIFVREDGEWKLACTQNTYSYVNRTSNIEVVNTGKEQIDG